jgi:hypothetical protein
MIEKLKRPKDGSEPKLLRAYSKEEAEALGVVGRPWREVEEAGEWALLDDGGVAEVYRVRPMVEQRGPSVRHRKEITTVLGKRFTATKSWRYDQGPDTTTLVLARKHRAKKTVAAYARMVLASPTGRLEESQMDDLAKFFAPGVKRDDFRRVQLKLFLRSKHTKNMVAKEIFDLLNKHQVTPDSIVEDMLLLRDQARMEGKLGVAHGILRDFQSMLKMHPEKEETRSEIEVNWKALLDSADELPAARETPLLEAPPPVLTNDYAGESSLAPGEG